MFLLTTAAYANAQTCWKTGSLSFQRELIVNQTYILPSCNITCEGVVTGWKFCYQIINVPLMPLMTFYPSVWRLSENNYYALVHASNVSYMPQHSSGLSNNCDEYPLPADEQFSVHTNDIIGLYSFNSLILTTNDSDDYLAYSVAGNYSIVDPYGSGVKKQHFHVAIVAIISE